MLYTAAIKSQTPVIFNQSAMSVSKAAFRPMMYYDFKKGLSYKECHESLRQLFGDECPSEATVSFWFREFRRGRTDFEDEPRSGRPAEAATAENADRLQQLVKEDPRITMKEIEEHLGIGSAAAQKLVHEHLGLTKRSARWVPHNLSAELKQARVEWCRFMLRKFDNGASKQVDMVLTGDETWIHDYDAETKQQSAVWLFPDEAPPLKVKRARSVGKRMVAVFFRKSGLVAVVPLKERRTVNASWYTTVCLPKVFQELRDQRPRTGNRGILLHHDNASAHTAAATLDFLATENVQLVTHPPYSPDLAPCDFWLFPKVKEELRGRRFASDLDALAALKETLKGLDKQSFQDCFVK